MTLPLFGDLFPAEPSREELGPGAVLLRSYALSSESALLAALGSIEAESPFRHMVTPGGWRMSVAMTNCGAQGWVTDETGYRYDALDPVSGRPWPGMPEVFRNLARQAAASAGFEGFEPDACLINRYEPGARLSLHQDKDERDLSAPVITVSLGVPATFQLGGSRRADKVMRLALDHGDVFVLGGASRLRYHGILALKGSHHPLTGSNRISLTFRKAT